MATTSFTSLLSYPEVLLATVSFLFIYCYYQSVKKSVIPVNWPVVGMLPGLLINLTRFHSWVTDLLHESNYTFKFKGPCFMGLDFWLTCNPANVNHVFNANFPNYPKGDEFLEIFDILGDGIFNADAESWKAQRKKAHVAITNPSFRTFLARCTKEKVDDVLVPLLKMFADQNVVLNLQDMFLRLTFDMTCNLVFGVDPGCLSEGLPNIPFANAMDDAMEAIFFRHILPPPWWKLLRWLGFGTERRLKTACDVIDDFVANNIARKREKRFHMRLKSMFRSSISYMTFMLFLQSQFISYNINNHRENRFQDDDLLSSYIDESLDIKDDKFLRDTTVNLMLAGRDTTGVALSWFFWLVTKHPKVKSKIVEEIEDGKDNVYLHAAICESLRLFPSVPFEHKSPLRTENLPSGEEVRRGDKIFFSTYSMGRMEGVWGKDCLEFRPERWISEGGRVKHEPSYKFLSFNCGPRTCLGKEIAFTQMKCVVARVLKEFDVELVDERVVEPKLSIILHMRNGLLVRVKRRERKIKC